MDFAALASFNRVAAHGGIGRASRATCGSKATLSRHIRELEDSLGVRLVERSARILRLTEEGAALHARTEGPMNEIREAAEDVVAGAGHPRGCLRVSVPILFAHMATGRIAADFARLHPDIRLDLSADDRNVDFVAEGYDVAVRVDPRPDPNLVGRCFLRDQHLIVAASELPIRRSDVDASANLVVPAVLLSGMPASPVWRVHTHRGVVELRPEPVMHVSSLLMVRDAIRAGVGAGVLPRSLVADDLASGSLVAWGSASERSVELWVLHTSRRLVSAKVEAFVGFLCATFEASNSDPRRFSMIETTGWQ